MDAIITWTEIEITTDDWTSHAPLLPALPAELMRRTRRTGTTTEPHTVYSLAPLTLHCGDEVRVQAHFLGAKQLSFKAERVEDSVAPLAAAATLSLPILTPLPAWCAWMMNDRERATAYDKALTLALAQRMDWGIVRILDLGCGAGLLSLLAARAAAMTGVPTEIVGVERETRLAAMAEAAFEAHRTRLPEWVTLRVICAEATELRLEGDSAHADGCFHLIVTEIFGDDALSERCLPLLRHASAHYLHPSIGAVIPQRLKLHAALAEAPHEALVASHLDHRTGELGFSMLEPRRVRCPLATRDHKID